MKFAKNIQSHNPVRHGGPYSISEFNSKIIDFSSNVNPLGFPSIIKKSLDYSKIPTYPDHNSASLKKALSKYLGLPISNITIGNGATELIYDLCRILPKSNAIIVCPTFGEYEAATRMYCKKVEFFTTLNLESDLQNLIKKIPKNGLIFVCNPNNPTGQLLPRKSMIKLLDAVKTRSSILFVDESFIELTQNPRESVVDLVNEYQNLFVLRSMTKSFGLAGLRIGYAVANKKMIAILDKVKIPWNINVLAHQAGIVALSDKKFLDKTRKLILSESKFLLDSISKIEGFSCFDTATNFILIKTKQPAKILKKKLLQKNILIRDCSNFRGLDSHYIRIAIRSRKENQRLVLALEKIS